MSTARTFDALGLARRLTKAGAMFEVVGSAVLSGTPADLDVVVTADVGSLRNFLDSVEEIGGWSRLSTRLPSPSELLNAGTWHFGTPDGPLDVFIGSVDEQ